MVHIKIINENGTKKKLTGKAALIAVITEDGTGITFTGKADGFAIVDALHFLTTELDKELGCKGAIIKGLRMMLG